MLVAGSMVMNGYLTRLRNQREMAAMTNEITNRQTYGSEALVTYENLESELRAGAIRDGYTDSERAALLEQHLGELMSYGDGDRFAIRIQTMSGYNVPEMLVTYAESQSLKELPSNEVADNTQFGDGSQEPESQPEPEEEPEPEGEPEGQEPESESQESGNSGTEEEPESPISRVIPNQSLPLDIGLNNEISSGIPKKTRFDIQGLIKQLEKAIKETEYGICYLRTVDAKSNVQIWYISDNQTIRLDQLLSKAPLDAQTTQEGTTVTGFSRESKDGLVVISGELNPEYGVETISDAYLYLAEQMSENGVVALQSGESYLFYVSDAARTTDFKKTLEGKTSNQRVLRSIKFYAETQFMSSDYAEFFASLKERFETGR